jgi:hypothetical protein
VYICIFYIYTRCYVKVLYLTFLTKPNLTLFNYKHGYEGEMSMGMLLIILDVLSILFGYITKGIFIGFYIIFFLYNSLFNRPIMSSGLIFLFLGVFPLGFIIFTDYKVILF